MPHDHTEEGHSHDHELPNNNAAFAIGVTLNFGFVLAEAWYGWAANSLALLSDAGHNLSDVFGLLLAWGAIRLSRALPTKRRTYGWRRSSILAALFNALFLLVAVGGIIWEALERLRHPQPVLGNTVIWVAAAGVIINTATALLFMAGRHRDLNIQGAFAHMAADAAVSLGVVGAGLVIRATGLWWLDPVVSLVIGAVIVWGTWGLLRASLDLALDAVPAGIDPHAVEEYLRRLPGVRDLHDLHIWGMSTTESALTVHLVMPEPPSTGELLEEIEHELHEHFDIGHTTIQIEGHDQHCSQASAEVV